MSIKDIHAEYLAVTEDEVTEETIRRDIIEMLSNNAFEIKKKGRKIVF